jgi:hypothetical protein
MGPDMVTHICSPSYLKGRSKRINVQAQPRHKLARLYLKKYPGVLVYHNLEANPGKVSLRAYLKNKLKQKN